MASYTETLRNLGQLTAAQQWLELRRIAIEAADEFPESAEVPAFAAHAMRQLGELEEGYAWAQRAIAIDPESLFARNRVSLLANLTKRYAEAYAAAMPVLDVEPPDVGGAQNIAVTIVNAIYAASRIDKIAEAVERFTPAIVRLDHDDLHFNSACLYALANDDRAYAYARKALAAGKPKIAFDDADFDAIRNDARLVALLARDWDAEEAALVRANKVSREELVSEDFLDSLPDGVVNAERHVELERAIDANVDDVESYVVYSDWLQGQSNPRGHFILASRRCLDAQTEDERMLAFVDWAVHLRAHAGEYLGECASHLGKSRFHLGFVRELALDLDDGELDPAAMLASALALPVCRFVRAITIGDLPVLAGASYDPIIDVLRAAPLPHLRALHIAREDNQPSWIDLDTSQLALPQLESLVIGGGGIETGALEFPALRRFAIQTSCLSRENLVAISNARWPHLEDLEIWFGETMYGAASFTAADLAAILRRPLRRLALRYAELTDEICAALVEAPVLAKLVELDLSLGSMTDVGASVLLRNRQYFAHLARLDLTGNAIPEEAAVELQRSLPNVWFGDR